MSKKIIKTQISTMEEFTPTTIVRSNPNKKVCIVLDNYEGRAIAVKTIENTNPQEWTIIKVKNE